MNARPLRGSFLAAAVTAALSAGWAHAQETLIVDTVFQLKTADPARAYEPTASLVMHPVYQTLVTFTEGDATTIKPALAELPVANEDVTSFTFTLRDGATFSDGSPVTQDDVLFSLNRALNVKGSASFIIRGLTFEAGEAENEIIVTSPRPDPGLPARLSYPAFAILNADVVRENGGTDAEDAAQTDTADAFLSTMTAGSGPYIIEKWDIASEVILVKNENYWGEEPHYDRIVVRNVANNAQQMNIGRGVSQLAIDLRPDQVGMLGDSVNVISQAGSDICFLYLNQNSEVSEATSNPDFIEAVRYAVDFDAIVDFVGNGAGRPGSIIPSILLGTLAPEKAPVRDLERARAALERSGIENPVIKLSYAGDIAKHGISFGDIGAQVQAQLAEIGITVELNPLPSSVSLDNYRAGTNEMGVAWWGPAFPDPSYYLAFNPGQLVGLRTGWAEGSDAAVEELADEAARTVALEERDAVYKAWQEQLNMSGPYIPLFQPPTTIVSSKTVEGVAFHPTWTVDLSEIRPAE